MAATVTGSVDVAPVSHKPIIKFSSNKLRKMEAKKRKIKAYLSLALSEDSLFNRKKRKIKDEETHINAPVPQEDDINALRNQLRDLRQKQEQDPILYLTDDGVQAKIFGTDPARSAIFLEDIQHLILLSCLRIFSPVKPRWCNLLRTNKLSHVLFVSVHGLSSEDYIQKKLQFVNTNSIFSDIVEMVPPSSFYTEIAVFPATLHCNALPQHSNQISVTSQPLKSLLPMTLEPNEEEKECKAMVSNDSFPRTQLLLSAVQMIHEDYPLPVNLGKDTSSYTWSLPVYKEVTNGSPIFSVDCEMCITDQNKSELTRVSIVNENHEVCLDTLVKPKNKIVNYMTRYSGVTKEMLANVNTTLDDVKEKIRNILPPDAILCGQSLNFDLHALNLFHPYVIDTSVIFNLSGMRHRKSSLKHLSHVFLKENIQENPLGHCSVEDSVATLKLVQMKLQKGLLFGDSILAAVDSQIPKESLISQSIFPMILSKQKSICVIGSSASLDMYSSQLLPAEVELFVKEKNRSIVKCTAQEAIQHNLTFSHLALSDGKDKAKNIKFVDESIANLYRSCAINSLIIVAFTGCTNNKTNGLCMARIKSL